YVDYLIVTDNSNSAILLFITNLGTQFLIKDLGNLTYFLGVEWSLLISGKCIEDIVDRASMDGEKSSLTPILTTNSLILDDSAHRHDLKVRLGSLQYLSLTHPDIAFSTYRLSQFVHHPTTNHWITLKRFIRYLIDTIDHGLFHHKNSPLNLHAFSGADWAGNKDDRTSTSANVIFLDVQYLGVQRGNILWCILQPRLNIVMLQQQL
uniref:Reverse transcriptase Ty1/copia-type domain-containing protein n=1 Tax=Solanum lycopersicum TaxID=4081 RepID=A0A3Q7EDM0_SOLLC